jgi:hypothetical protein
MNPKINVLAASFGSGLGFPFRYTKVSNVPVADPAKRSGLAEKTEYVVSMVPPMRTPNDSAASQLKAAGFVVLDGVTVSDALVGPPLVPIVGWFAVLVVLDVVVVLAQTCFFW